MSTLNIVKRKEFGTLRMRRMRKAGKIPAVLYGHGEDTVSVAVDAKDVNNAIRQGSQIVDLKGDFNESALIKEVQWDAFGSNVLHLDLTRVDANEAVEVTLQIELVGDAPGSKAGGMVRHMLHELNINCPANMIPEKLEVKITGLELNDTITAGEVTIPDGATLIEDADAIVVQCTEVEEREEELADADAGLAEPEVIGRKEETDESGGDE